MENTLLSVQNLSVSLTGKTGIVTLVSNLSFSIERGETLGLVGESGSGKSITAFALLGLLPPGIAITEGEIAFSSRSGYPPVILNHLAATDLTKYRGKHIAMVFQEPMTSLNPSMKCGRQVAEMLQWHEGLDVKKAMRKSFELFEEVHLPEPGTSLQKYPHELSGGQRQRVMIAMAIACKPLLLIADEPTTALDVSVQKSILELLTDIQARHGTSILFISHDLGVIASFAHKTLVLRKGCMVEQGLTPALLKNPVAGYTKALLACRPPLSYKPNRLATICETELEAVHEFPMELDSNDAGIENSGQLTGKNLPEPLLSVHDLSASFLVKSGLFGGKTTFTAVNRISFDVFPGETLGIVGESGSGKSTLARTLMRLLESSEGSVAYRGTGLAKMNSKQIRQFRRKFQLIFQDPYSSLNPLLPVGYALMEPQIVHGIGNNNTQRRERVFSMLERVKLDREHFFRYPHEFSGGQRQRIAIARALVMQPEFLICDESVSALDVSIQAQILNLLKDLKEEFKLTYIFISHDLAVIRYMSDRVLVMRNGALVEYGNTDSLYNAPVSPYLKDLLAAVPGIR